MQKTEKRETDKRNRTNIMRGRGTMAERGKAESLVVSITSRKRHQRKGLRKVGYSVFSKFSKETNKP